MPNLTLLPRPRSLELLDGHHVILDGRAIVVQDSSSDSALLGAARRLKEVLRQEVHVRWPIVQGVSLGDLAGVTLRLAPEQVSHDQGYALTIDPEEILIEARTPAGIFYGVCSLIQIVELSGDRLPCLRVRDWPDFPARGVMLDVSRDKVPTMATLCELVDMLASWKINQVQLYTEHTFAYQRHPEVWADASPITAEEIRTLDAFCRDRFVELVPNQNSFGHMQRWLKLPRYAHLAEINGPFRAPWGEMIPGPFSLCAVDPRSLEFVRGLYDELLPNFTSRQLNVGCDETMDLGQGGSADACRERGTGRVYLDYLLGIYRDVTRRGYTMQFWGDIVNQHPELIPDLPRDAIALEWGYEAGHPFAERTQRFAAAGVPFYVCPGTSAWNSIAGRTGNAVANLQTAAEHGLAHGATGYLITDWGDSGHWQMQPVSFLGFAAGAAYSWAWQANRDLDLPRALSLYAFYDPTGSMGRIATELGNVYQLPGLAGNNGSELFGILQSSFPRLRERIAPKLTPEALREALRAIEGAMEPLGAARLTRPDVEDAQLVMREQVHTAMLMRHACHRGLLALGALSTHERHEMDDDLADIIDEYEALWLIRNRAGGLPDSVARLHRAREDYRAAP